MSRAKTDEERLFYIGLAIFKMKLYFVKLYEISVTEYSSVTVAYENISKLYKLNDFIV